MLWKIRVLYSIVAFASLEQNCLPLKFWCVLNDISVIWGGLLLAELGRTVLNMGLQHHVNVFPFSLSCLTKHDIATQHVFFHPKLQITGLGKCSETTQVSMPRQCDELEDINKRLLVLMWGLYWTLHWDLPTVYPFSPSVPTSRSPSFTSP